MLCLEDENVLADSHRLRAKTPPNPPQLITTVSNTAWNVLSLLGATVTQLIWLPATSALTLMAASNKWAECLQQVRTTNLTLPRPTGGASAKLLKITR